MKARRHPDHLGRERGFERERGGGERKASCSAGLRGVLAPFAGHSVVAEEISGEVIAQPPGGVEHPGDPVSGGRIVLCRARQVSDGGGGGCKETDAPVRTRVELARGAPERRFDGSGAIGEELLERTAGEQRIEQVVALERVGE